MARSDKDLVCCSDKQVSPVFQGSEILLNMNELGCSRPSLSSCPSHAPKAKPQTSVSTSNGLFGSAIRSTSSEVICHLTSSNVSAILRPVPLLILFREICHWFDRLAVVLQDLR